MRQQADERARPRARARHGQARAKASSVSRVGLDAATDSVLFLITGGVSFCSGVDAPEVLDSEPKVTPPSLVYTPSDLTSPRTR
jgi:hypothetical protein